VINCGRGPGVLRFNGVLVLGKESAFDLKHPGVRACRGLRQRLEFEILDEFLGSASLYRLELGLQKYRTINLQVA